MKFLEAIAHEEGFYVPGSRASRNNNPGNINFGPFTEQFGAVLETIPHGYAEKARFAAFPLVTRGWDAMKALLSGQAYNGLTVRTALLKWAPPSDGNDTSSYEANVCAWVGCSPFDPIAPLVEAG